MYTVIRTKGFEKSLKKIRRAGFSKKDEATLVFVIDSLISGKQLDKKYRDHQLKGEYNDYRECHVLNDLLLIYKIEKGELVLILFAIGSHSQLF